MKELIVLYNATQSLNYHIVHLLNPPPGDGSSLQKIYREMFEGRKPRREPIFGPFKDIADLDRYCFKITQHFNLKGIGLLELERYNRIVEETHNLTEFKMILFKKCDYIENPDYRKTGLLKKLLN